MTGISVQAMLPGANTATQHLRQIILAYCCFVNQVCNLSVLFLCLSQTIKNKLCLSHNGFPLIVVIMLCERRLCSGWEMLYIKRPGCWYYSECNLLGLCCGSLHLQPCTCLQCSCCVCLFKCKCSCWLMSVCWIIVSMSAGCPCLFSDWDCGSGCVCHCHGRVTHVHSTLMELLSNVPLRAESNLSLQQDEQKECLSFSGLCCGSCVCTLSTVCASNSWELLGELGSLQRQRGCAPTAQAAQNITTARNRAQMNLNKQGIWIILKQKCLFLNSQMSESRAASGHGAGTVRVSIVLKWTEQQENWLVWDTGSRSPGTEHLLYSIFRFLFCYSLKGTWCHNSCRFGFCICSLWCSAGIAACQGPHPISYFIFVLFLLLCLSPVVP